MKEKKQTTIIKFITNILELTTAALGIYGILGAEIPLWTKIVILVIFGIIIGYLIYSFIKLIKYHLSIDSDKSTVGSVKLKKHIKDLIKIAKRNNKIIKKEKKYSTNYSDVFKKKICKVLRNDVFEEINENAIYTGYSKKCYFKAVLQNENAIFSLKNKASYDSCKEISECISDIDHVLLSSNQFTSRVFFGEYLKNCHVKYFDKIKAEVDMLGWTYALAGKKDKSQNILNEAINEIKGCLENIKEIPTKNSDPELIYFYYNANLYLQRAYRHLAANPKIRRDLKLSDNIENLIKAEQALDNFYLDKNNNKFQPYLTQSQINEIERNKLGIKFGFVETYYDFAKQLFKSGKNYHLVVNYLEMSIKHFDELYKNKEILNKIDKHREINLTIIANKIMFLVESVFKNKEMPKVIAEYANNFKCTFATNDGRIDNSLEEIKTTLKSAIYVDQAIESYIQQRIFQCYKKVGKIYNVNYGDNLEEKEKK